MDIEPKGIHGNGGGWVEKKRFESAEGVDIF
jgi:hypothetical protein